MRDRHDWHGLCGARFGGLLRRFRPSGHLRGHRRRKIAALRRGEIPIFEPGLDMLVASNVKARRLNFTTDLAGPVDEADAVFIAVGTPSRRGDGHADLSFVHNAAREIAGQSTASPWSSPNRRCRSAPATRLDDHWRDAVRRRLASWYRIRNSCAKAPPSRTSSIRTASSSAPRTSGRER